MYIFLSKFLIQLNPKKLYAADGHEVQELSNVAKILYDAKKLKIEKNLHMDKNWIYQVKKMI